MANSTFTIADLRHGRNGIDPPQSLPDGQVADAVNVDWIRTPFGRRRPGCTALSLSGAPFTFNLLAMCRHVPGTDETKAELWGIDQGGLIGRYASGVWTQPTLKDAVTTATATFASLNGKLFIAYGSAQDRLHCWDPVSGSVRRTGLAPMGTPTVGDTGSGSYANTKRYFRTRATEQRSGVTYRRSEYSTIISYTPSGSGAGALVTQGTPPNEGETHWEIEAGTDGATFFRIGTVAIGTTTFTDSNAPAAYSTFPLSDVTGFYTVQKSYRFIAADQARLLGFGSFTSTDPQNNVEYSAVLGSSNVGDDERVPIGNYVGLDENASGQPTALIGPVNGSFFAAKYRQFWKMTPTGNVVSPYSTRALTKQYGVINPYSVVVGEDEVGNPVLMWLSLNGFYRYGTNGIEYIGHGIEDQINGAIQGDLSVPGATALNLNATIVSHAVWFADLRQMWCWYAIGEDTFPNHLAVFSVGRTQSSNGDSPIGSGWSRFTGAIASASASTMFGTFSLVPYFSVSTFPVGIGIANSGSQDFGTNYQATITTKAYAPWGNNTTGTVQGVQLVAPVQSGVTLTVTSSRDFGILTASDTASLTATGSEARVTPRLGGAVNLGDCQYAQFTIGDGIAQNVAWTIDNIDVTWTKGAEVVG